MRFQCDSFQTYHKLLLNWKQISASYVTFVVKKKWLIHIKKLQLAEIGRQTTNRLTVTKGSTS